MGYLDEAGLAALVGKVKGQMVELTAEEYAQIDPAIKNYDNKLYFVKNDITGYQIDNEPVANSDGLVKSGGIYNWTSKIGSGTLTTTAKTLIPAVNELNNGLSALLKIKTVNTETKSIERGYISAPLNTPSGYTPIGIVQYKGSGISSFYIQEMCISGSNAQAYVRAISGSASSLSMSFKVLFVKTGYIS